MLRHCFGGPSYHLFEDPDVVARLRQDPQGFLDGLALPALLDEIQSVPEVFNFVRARIDRQPRRTGQWFLTGSQEAGLMRNVTESMAGRAAAFRLLPMPARESDKADTLRAGFPEVLARPAAASLWCRASAASCGGRLERGCAERAGVGLARLRFGGAALARTTGPGWCSARWRPPLR